MLLRGTTGSMAFIQAAVFTQALKPSGGVGDGESFNTCPYESLSLSLFSFLEMRLLLTLWGFLQNHHYEPMLQRLVKHQKKVYERRQSLQVSENIGLV